MSSHSDELQRGTDLATALVDHLRAMGNAGACIIPVLDRADEYVVVVMSKKLTRPVSGRLERRSDERL